MKLWLRIASLFIVLATTFVAGNTYRRVRSEPRFLPMPPIARPEKLYHIRSVKKNDFRIRDFITLRPYLLEQDDTSFEYNEIKMPVPPLPVPQPNPAAILPRAFWTITFTSYAIAITLFVFSGLLHRSLPGMKSKLDLLVAHYRIELSVLQLRLIGISTVLLPIVIVLIIGGFFGNESGDPLTMSYHLGVVLLAYFTLLGVLLIPNRPKSLFGQHRHGFEVVLPANSPRKVTPLSNEHIEARV